jgi:transposase-like protein
MEFVFSAAATRQAQFLSAPMWLGAGKTYRHAARCGYLRVASFEQNRASGNIRIMGAMTDTEIQQRFIALRAQGVTYARIAQELGVCKRTLINWSRRFQYEINNQRAIELEALQESLVATREARARIIAQQLHAVEEELKKRSLADVPTSRLFAMADSLRRQILRETGAVEFTSPISDIPKEEFHDEIQKWAA